MSDLPQMSSAQAPNSKQTAELITALIEVLGADSVILGDDIGARACSYWDSSPMQAKAVLLPRTTQQVSAVLKLCHQKGQTVVTQGGLTGCVEGAHSGSDDVILSLERMNCIEEIDVMGGTAVVQSGVVLQNLQDRVATESLYFPLDLGARASCTIGGNVATNAGGINVLRYGMMRNLVLGLEAVLVDGTVVSSMNQMLKNNAGYDIKQLFIGSEGTLGVITRVTVKLFPQPSSVNTALLACDSFAQVTAVLHWLNTALSGTLSAFEIMWGEYYQFVTEADNVQMPMPNDHAFYVLLEARGNSQHEDAQRFEQGLEKALEDDYIVDVVLPNSENKRQALWAVREGFQSILNEQLTFMYDVSLPIKSMPEYVDAVQVSLKQVWPSSQCFVFGHLADGNLHVFVQPGQAGEYSTTDLRDISDKCIYTPLKAVQGSVSAEHGIGLEKKAWLHYSRSEEEIQLMRLIKRSLDPKNLLNPGVIFD